MTNCKLKLQDDTALRQELDALYEQATQETLCQYGLALVDHLVAVTGFPGMAAVAIQEGLATNRAWQAGQARMHDVRQAGFRVHQLTKEAQSDWEVAVIRVIGHAVGTAHMREHAMVASDYAIKAINRLVPGDREAVRRERQWQVATLADGVASQNH